MEQVSAERMAARQLVSTHSPASVTNGEKRYWMLVTVPEKPVADEKVVLYFNRAQSDALRCVHARSLGVRTSVGDINIAGGEEPCVS